MSDVLPQSAAHDMVKTNGIRLHTVMAGPKGGDPVVLLHGFPEFWYGWRFQISALADAGYRVIVPDQRGYNRSEKPSGIDSYTVDTLAADVIGLLDTLGYEQAQVVGHDWGAGVTWQALLAHSERIERAVVMDVPHPVAFEEYLRETPSQILRSGYMGLFQLPSIPEWTLSAADWCLLRWFIDTSDHDDTFTDDDLARYRDAWSRPGAFTGMLNWYRALLRGDREQPPTMTVETPTMVLWGAQDSYLHPEMAQLSIEHCTDSRLEVIESATHWLHHEVPDRVNSLLLEFLD